MVILKRTLFFSLVLTQFCFAQWYQQRGITSDDLYSVCFVDNNTGWAVGDGVILKTISGGENWLETDVPIILNSVFFTDATNGWAVGWDGVIIKTIDGGENWINQESETNKCLYSVYFSDSLTGWVVGDSCTILKTTDGGNTWINRGGWRNNNLRSVHFEDNYAGWIVGNGIIIKTNDGGENWSETDVPITLNSVFFTDANNGWAVGSVIIHTTDGGEHWSTQSAPTADELLSVHFIDDFTGWATEGGTILHTINAGITWSTQYISSGADKLSSIYFTDNNTGVVVGFITLVGAGGVIIKTTDVGENWLSKSLGMEHLFSVNFTDKSTGWAVGGTIIKTTDSGESWFRQESDANGFLNSVYFKDNNSGFAIGDVGTIIQTTNGGEDWINKTSGVNTKLSSIYFIDNYNGWIAGDSGIILKTTNSGENWIIKSSGVNNNLHSISFVDINTGWVGGENIILKTTDGGENWFIQLTSSDYWAYSIYFTDINNGWATGYGTILHTTNGGEDWITQLNPPIYVELNSIYFINSQTGWAVGGQGVGNYLYVFAKTTNGGENWEIESLMGLNFFGSWLSSVYFTDINTGWVVGSEGIILHTTNGGVSFVEEEQIDEIPTEFLLSQNFPNPFNPSTKIKYSVPQSSNITLTVFDILGNEIETLVNEEKPAGTYEVEFNASALPSGVYFYQLKAGSFLQTKKMLFLK